MGLLDDIRLKQAQKRAQEGAWRSAGLLEYQAALDSAREGAVGAPGGLLNDTRNPYRSYSDVAIAGATMAPGIGDVVGPVYDAQNFIRNPESRTLPNYALAAAGLLPAVPSLAYLMNRGGGAARTAGEVGRQAGSIGGVKAAENLARVGNDGPMNALRRAELMHAKGESADKIWRDTARLDGYPAYIPKDGQPRFEYSDAPMKLKTTDAEGRYLYWDVIDHPEMQAAYPDIYEPVTVSSNAPQSEGMYRNPELDLNPDQLGYYGSIEAFGQNENELRKSLLHELNHAGTWREPGHAVGGNPFSSLGTPEAEQIFIDDYDMWRSDPDRVAADAPTPGKAAFKAYMKLADEEQARAVERRMWMTQPELGERPIWNDFDTPMDQQIVRYGDGPNAMVNDLPMDEASRMQRARGLLGM